MSKPFRTMQPCDAKLDEIRYPNLVQPKIDGAKMLVREGKQLGRSLKPFANKFLNEFFSKDEFNGLEGEMIAGFDPAGPDLCRKTTSMINTIDLVPTEFCFVVFDCFEDESITFGHYHERLLVASIRVEALQKKYGHHISCISPGTRITHCRNTLNNAIEVFYEHGYEGTVIWNPAGFYKNGRVTAKSQEVVRVKPYKDDEAVVIAVIESMENQNESKINELGLAERSSHKENKVAKGLVGSLICKYNGEQIRVGAGTMKHDERKYFFDNQHEIIGKTIKFKSLDFGVKDKPRHPVFLGFRAKADMPGDNK